MSSVLGKSLSFPQRGEPILWLNSVKSYGLVKLTEFASKIDHPILASALKK